MFCVSNLKNYLKGAEVPWLFKKLLQGRCKENDDVLMSPTLDEDESYVEKKKMFLRDQVETNSFFARRRFYQTTLSTKSMR